MKFSNSVLLVIDMQKYFLEKDAYAYLRNGREIITNVLNLIELFREKQWPVIFTKHAHKKGDDAGQMGKWWNDKLPWLGDSQSELIDDIKPKENELVIIKTKYSAFEKTELEKYLRERFAETVVICGVTTQLCVETTARHAFMLDFQPVVIEDACAAKTKEYHKAALLNLSYGFAKIIKTNSIK